MELTDVQWELLKPLVEPRTPKKRRGRPWRDTRQVLEGVLWILRTGAQWSELPHDKFPPYQTCHRRFQQWVHAGTLVKILRRLAEDLLARGDLDLAETFIDASFSGEKGGRAVAPTRRGKGSKSMPIADCHGLPVAVGIASASPHETKLVEATLQQRFTRTRPQRMIGDLAYDSDPLDQRLPRRGIRLIAPHKTNRVRGKTQDGRELRRYCRRWKTERLFAWLHNFRRLVTGWEYHEANLLGLVQLGCVLISMRNYL